MDGTAFDDYVVGRGDWASDDRRDSTHGTSASGQGGEEEASADPAEVVVVVGKDRSVPEGAPEPAATNDMLLSMVERVGALASGRAALTPPPLIPSSPLGLVLLAAAEEQEQGEQAEEEAEAQLQRMAR